MSPAPGFKITPKTIPKTDAELLACLASWEWRIFSGQLYRIIVKGDDDDDDDPGTQMPFIPNAAQRRFMKNLHYRNLILKARQLGFCLDVSTRVLTADLRWVRIDAIKPGDEVVGVDEHVPGGRGAGRKMRTATVEAVNKVRRMGYRITFADGREVVCTDQHPWLGRSGHGRQPFWRAMDKSAPNAERDLKVGHQVRSICTPWGDGDFEDGWMGGVIDGEGNIALPSRTGASVCVAQRPGPVMDRMVRYARERGYAARKEDDASDRKTKHGKVPVPKLCFTRMDEIFRLIGQTRPTRMIGNRFWEGKELPGKRNADNSAWNEIVSIEPVGMVDMIDLQTSTGTFIAEGMVSHNTTLIAILWLDHALFNADQRCGIIAQTERDVLVIFRDKVRFAYNNLPEFLRKLMPLKKDSAEELLFAHNNSSVRVGLSMRSGTIHRLHISEMGKIAAKTPDKALEIVTGSFPTVPSNGIIVIESTAEGQSGEFFKIAQKAQKLWEIGRRLTRAEFRFHFFPWMDEPKYKSDPTHVYISPEQHKYFDGVQKLMKRIISLPQRAWWVEKLANDFSGEEDKMWREMPSTPQECWQKSTEGTFFAKQLTAARMQGRIGDVPHVTHVPVNTFWDIGSGDGTAIWLHQYIGTQNRFIGFIEGWDEGYEFYVKRLRDTGYLFGTMYLPHDAAQTRQLKDTIGSPMDMLRDLAPDWRYMIVPRTPTFQMGIETTRKEFSTAWFDEKRCEKGLVHIAEYKKRWNRALAVWSDQPDKDNPHTEAADALRQWAQGFDPAHLTMKTRPSRSRTRHLGGTVA